MTDDIPTLRAALAAHVCFRDDGKCFSYNTKEWHSVANPDRIARLLDRLEAAERDAARYRWLRTFNVDSYMARGMLNDLDAAIDAAMHPEGEK